jgi:hypothetical protein
MVIHDYVPQSWVASGVLTPRAIPWEFLSTADLRLSVNGAAKVAGTHYSVAGDGRTAAATLTPLEAWVGTVILSRETPERQNYDLIAQHDVQAETLELELDRRAMIEQELAAGLADFGSRALQVPQGAVAPPVDLTGLIEGDLLQYRGGALRRFEREAFAGKLYGGGAGGVPVPITGNGGADAALRGDLALASGAQLSGFSHAYAYAPGSVGWRLSKIVVATDAPFNAVGNGIANDTAALQAGATFAAGRRYVIPKGTYKITEPIIIPIDCIVEGWGAVFIMPSQFNALRFIDGGAMFGGEIIGPASGVYDANGIGIFCAGTRNPGAAPTFVTAPELTGVTVRNLGLYGVGFEYTKGGWVKEGELSGIGYAGVGGVSTEGLSVRRSIMKTIGPGPMTGDAYGVFIDRKNGTAEIDDPRSKGFDVEWCDISDVIAAGGVNGHGIDTHGGENFGITNNRVTGCQAGIYATASSIGAAQALGPKRGLIAHNQLFGTAASVSYGLLVRGAFNGGDAVVEAATDIRLVNNFIEGFGGANDPNSGAVYARGTKNMVIDGITVARPKSNGINLGKSNINVSIRNHTIIDPYDAVGLGVCIRVSGPDVTGVVEHGTLIADNGALAANVANIGIRVDAALTGLGLRIGKHELRGISATKLTYSEATSPGVTLDQFQRSTQLATINLVSGAANNSVTITFAERLVRPPVDIQLTPTGGIAPGGKVAELRPLNITATGMDLVAYPSDLSAWLSSGVQSVFVAVSP